MPNDRKSKSIPIEILSHEVIAKFQKAQDFFSEAEDKKEALLCKIR